MKSVVHNRPSATRSLAADRVCQSLRPALLAVLRALHDDDWDAVALGSSDCYNDAVTADHKQGELTLLPCNHIVLCVGHSKKKWRGAKQLLESNVTDPFDNMSECTGDAMQALSRRHGTDCQVFYSHSWDPFLVSFQRLAVATGLGAMHKESHMVLHRRFGPWMALRLALVFPCSPKPENGVQEVYCREDIEAFVRSVKTEHDELVVNDNLVKFDVQEGESRVAAEIIRLGLEDAESREVNVGMVFLKARKSFSTGKHFMYDDDQMQYHYGSLSDCE